MKTSERNIFEALGFDVLDEYEMNEVRGGTRPKTRDKDVFADEEDE